MAVDALFAASTQQSIALVIFLVAAVGWILWILASIRRARPEVGAEIELAPNRKPWYSDEELEGFRLERAQLFGLACLVVVGVGLPLYWLAEPGRQDGAVAFFRDRAAGDAVHVGQPVGGEALFAPTAEGGFDCAGCHGGLDGGVAPYTITDPVTNAPVRQVDWPAPALRYVALRMNDEQLRQVLVYGRPYSPMPPWGLEGGGPLNDQQIDNLIAYLKSVAGVEPYSGEAANAEEAREAAAAAAQAELDRMRSLPAQLETARAALAEATSLSDRTNLQNRIHSLETEIALEQEQTLGAALYNVNCARCHTFGWSTGDPQAPGSGAMGPALFNVLSQFPTEEGHIAWVRDGGQIGARYGRFGLITGRMPYFGKVLTEDQIEAIVDYERSLDRTATGG
ncbi:MAG: cytochrome c [Acidimicrobiia bacterium]